MTARRVIAKPGAAPTPSVAAQEVGRHAALIEEDVLAHVTERLPVAPPPPISGDVGAPLFVGVNRFF